MLVLMESNDIMNWCLSAIKAAAAASAAAAAATERKRQFFR